MSKIKTPEQVEIDKVIGQRLRSLRLSTKTKAIALAAHLSVYPEQLGKYERGANSITVPRLIAAAHFMNVDPAVFLQGFVVEGQRSGDLELDAAFLRIRKLEQELEKIKKIANDILTA